MPDPRSSSGTESHPSALSGAFRKPFTEQIAFFRRKLGNLVPTERWDDIERSAHDDAFMVAGAQKADLLADLAAAVDRAIAEGKSLDAFRKDFRAIVERHGWHGWTGEDSKAGRAWRTRTIYRTNAATSYSAGRHAQLVAGNFPLWVYRHGSSEHPRLVHLSWNGLVLPPDHPFWRTHYPPSAFNCSCYALGARSERAARRLGGDPEKKLPTGWDRIDPKTGRPKGIGKGWDYAPGESVAELVDALAKKLGAWDYRIAKGFMEGLPPSRADALSDAYRALPGTADDVRRYAQRVYEPKPDLPDPPPVRTLGLVRGDQADDIEQIADVRPRGYDFSLDRSAVEHIVKNHAEDAVQRRQGQRGVTAADFAQLPRIVSAPDTLTLAGKSHLGEDVIELTKTIGGETFVARFAIGGKRRRTLSLKTLFIKIGGKTRPRAKRP